MTSIDQVTDLGARVQYVAAAAQTTFDYPFPIFEDADLVVDIDGTTKTLTTDYTVTGAGADTGGTIVLVVAATGGEIVTIYRQTAITRTTDFQQNGPLSSTSFNDQLDKLTIIAQELEARVNRALRVPFTAEVDDADIELTVANWANKYVTIDADGKPTPAALSSATMTQATIGNLLYPQTAAEQSAGVTPTNYYYEPGDVRRYGAAIDGSTDDRTAIQAAYDQFKQGGPAPILPAGVSYVSKNGSNTYALLFDDDAILDGGGHFTLKGDGVNNYNLIKIINGTNIKIDIRGIFFDCGKSSPSRPSDNEDICVRIESSVDTLNIEDCDFKNYNEDGVYFRASVTGAGGRIHHNRFRNGARSAVTLSQGQYVSIDNNDIKDILLQPVNVQATDINTVCRQISVDRNRIISGGTDTNSAGDRAAIFMAHVDGAASSVMGQYACRGNVIKDFASAYGGAAFGFGIEIREVTDAIIEGNEVTGCLDAGLFSYLTTRAAFIGNLSCGNDKGLWMNKCTDYSDIGNTCANNTTADRDYHGPDGATTYLQADGLMQIIARGSVTFNAGTPSLSDSFGISSLTDLGTGDTKFTFSRTVDHTTYSVIATPRSVASNNCFIESATHNGTDFRIVTTLSGGAASDEFYDFIVVARANSTTVP